MTVWCLCTAFVRGWIEFCLARQAPFLGKASHKSQMGTRSNPGILVASPCAICPLGARLASPASTRTSTHGSRCVERCVAARFFEWLPLSVVTTTPAPGSPAWDSCLRTAWLLRFTTPQLSGCHCCTPSPRPSHLPPLTPFSLAGRRGGTFPSKLLTSCSCRGWARAHRHFFDGRVWLGWAPACGFCYL